MWDPGYKALGPPQLATLLTEGREEMDDISHCSPKRLPNKYCKALNVAKRKKMRRYFVETISYHDFC